MSNNKIIERILKDAQARCDEIVAKAQSQKEAMLADNAVRLANQRKELEQSCEAQSKVLAVNELANAELYLKKLRLKQKRELLDEAYSLAHKAVLGFSSADYLALISRLLKQYAEKGERVDFAKKDEKNITQAFLDKLNLGLKLGKPCSIEGGVILHGEGYSKNLSLESLFETVREQTEIEVANALFLIK